MKLLCFLMLFASVKNLIAVFDIEYRKAVVKTNADIVMAACFLPEIIQNIVCGKYSMDEMTLMLAVPERGIKTQTPMSFEDEHEMLWIQGHMQSEIRNKLGDITSELHERGYQGWSMSALGNQRRHRVSDAIKKLMEFVISGKSPNFKLDLTHFPHMCRLIGLYRALKNPDAFIEVKDTQADNLNCLITFVDGNAIKYRRIDDEIVQLNDIDIPFQSLSFQVNYLYHE